MKLHSTASVRKRGSGREFDPYLAKLDPGDKAACLKCHAVYHNKHWSLPSPPRSNGSRRLINRERTLAQPPERKILCPACQKIRDHFPMGIVTLKGDYVQKHRGEILNLIHNEESRARGFNPLERLISVYDQEDALIVETTTEKLAQRIGSRLQHSYKGDVRYKWSRQNRFIRVDWERNLEPER
ncbi:MAG: ATPase [Deltaproteobacteria bacterium]|nr:ATPase [Deltaproteobacteria bacterium]